MHPSTRLLSIAELTSAFRRALGAVLLAIVGAFMAAPRLQAWLADPDGITRWAAIAFFGSSIGLAGWALWRGSASRRAGYLVIALGVVGLGEEVASGASLFGFEPPEIGGVAVRGVHDLFDVVRVIAPGTAGRVTLAALAFVVASTIALVVFLHRHRLRSFVVENRAVLLALGSSVLFLSPPAVALFGATTTHRFVAEILGMVGAGLLVTAAMSLHDHRRTVAGWRRRIRPWMVDERPLSDIPTAGPGIDG